MKIVKRILLYLFIVLLLGATYVAYKVNNRLNPKPTIEASPTSIIGFNHIGISVRNLDKMLPFYQAATGFELLNQTTTTDYEGIANAFGQDSIRYLKATLKGPNMLLELLQFSNQTDENNSKMPPQGPGMTHTCYQTSMDDSGYDKFVKAGVDLISRGDEPIDLGGYGVTYAYGYDPEGNMVELEQMANFLVGLKIGKKWATEHPMWMTQVAIISPNLPRLTAFYQKVLAIEPYRVGSYRDNSGFDAIVNVDSVAFDAAWFGMDTQGKKLELMQYINPKTSDKLIKRKPTDLGYTFSLEVTDIQAEYQRLKALDIELVSEPQQIGAFWEFFAYDVDGNVFSLRQAIDENSAYSLKNFE